VRPGGINLNDPSAAGSIFGGSFLVLIGVITYVVFCVPLYVMGQKTDSQHSWFAFVPILNIALLLEIAGKDLWWILLFFVPCVNVVVAVIVWMGVAEAMDKPGWLGILMLVPVVNWILPYYLAFG